MRERERERDRERERVSERERKREGGRGRERERLKSLYPQNEIQLTITVEGSNEHAPVFEQDRYNIPVSEYNALSSSGQQEPGDVVLTVVATDADLHDVIQYSITGGNEEDVFEIPDDMVSTTHTSPSSTVHITQLFSMACVQIGNVVLKKRRWHHFILCLSQPPT